MNYTTKIHYSPREDNDIKHLIVPPNFAMFVLQIKLDQRLNFITAQVKESTLDFTSENPYQSSTSTICPSDWTFLEAKRSSCRGVTKVMPLAEMARVRICRWGKRKEKRAVSPNANQLTHDDAEAYLKMKSCSHHILISKDNLNFQSKLF